MCFYFSDDDMHIKTGSPGKKYARFIQKRK